jgi:hypothetical protein
VKISTWALSRNAVEVKLERASAPRNRRRREAEDVDRAREAEDVDATGDERNASRTSAPRAVCPLYPKIKREGWWVVVGDEVTNELFALRRVSFGAAATLSLSLDGGDRDRGGDFEARDLTVFLVSDCYLGLDQEVSVDAVCDSVSAGVGTAPSRRNETPDAARDGEKKNRLEDSFWLGPGDVVDDVSVLSSDPNEAFFWENET